MYKGAAPAAVVSPPIVFGNLAQDLSSESSELTELSVPPGLTHPSVVSFQADSDPVISDAPGSASTGVREASFFGSLENLTRVSTRESESGADEHREEYLTGSNTSINSVIFNSNNSIAAESTPISARPISLQKKYPTPTVED
ncbi:hypothetical protein H0H93_004169, partial [Arthromyces matolae]